MGEPSAVTQVYLDPGLQKCSPGMAPLVINYSTEQRIDAVFTVGQYNVVSWALNSFGVPLDDFLPGGKPQ